MTIGSIASYVFAALALTGALSVVLAKNPIRSAMGLLLLILSVAALFLGLDAQFLAAVQLIVYAGAIVVLFLFVIMLLGPMATPPQDRRGLPARAFGAGLFALAGLGAMFGVWRVSVPQQVPPFVPVTFGGIDAFGSVLFTDALVPFEVASILLMVAVVGAIAVARGRQGVRSLSKSELESVETTTVTGEPQHSGVFSHEIHLPEPGTLDAPAPKQRAS